MKINYSKSLSDIAPERTERLSEKINDKYQTQIEISQILHNSPPREKCLVCQNLLEGSEFIHRSIPFIQCNHCGHIQTKSLPPEGYPFNEKIFNFNNVYTDLDSVGYENRIERVYKPKLNWIEEVLTKYFTKEELHLKKWVELGCGAGYFLSCLNSNNYKNITGFEMDLKLLKTADSMTSDYVKVLKGDTNLHRTIRKCSADIYVAFFVLEHVLNPYKFYQELSNLPPKTIFVFSVPVFGLSSLLEGVFDKQYARNLDTVLHTQIYTDQSIEYALNIANYDIIGQWVFGQDVEDFSRFVLSSIKNNYPENIFQKISTKLFNIENSIQHVLDQNHFSDARHIIAIKR